MSNHTTSTPPQTPTIDLLLRLVPDSPTTVQSHLQSHPSLASSADNNGYTLLHASASYAQLSLLRTLITTYAVDPNIRDTDGETPLFAAETVEVARALVEELGADVRAVNTEGVSVLENARENVEDGGEWALVVEYLARRVEVVGRDGSREEEEEGQMNGASGPGMVRNSADSGRSSDRNGHAPPPLPPGVRITGMRTVQEEEQEAGQGAPDPEFRRRIEELAAREDFQTEEGQAQLKALVEDAVGGLRGEGEEREVRRRVG